LSVVDETIVPVLELPPTTPFTSQVTAVLVVLVVVVLVRFTTAVKSACAPGLTVAEVGVMETDDTVTAPFPPHPERIPAAVKMSAKMKSEVRPFSITGLPRGDLHPERWNWSLLKRRERNSNAIDRIAQFADK
jgi:hypothetical protein